MDQVPLMVRVEGEYACFTRPEMKVERVSYPVPTPSAARGILEAIFWKPEFHWVVHETRVLKPIRYASLLRNEVKSKATYSSIQRWEATNDSFVAAADRTQRHTVALFDVAYVILASVVLHPHANAEAAKYRDQFRRRAEQGRCFMQPYLGCREFSAYFSPPNADEAPIAESMDLGPMLYDLDYRDPQRNVPVFFEAKLDRGIIRYPTPEEVGLCS
ncbi:MAG: type I-C CRISPR-associated protein Cas5c [Anaerolineae bacterium]|jgi:CRISPR-associated protein Cas5d|nr:type I-C CRISPR-associated protein Cas5 [Chloroflexota bacterium]